MNDPLVIIPYHNGAEWILNLLRTLPANLEVLVVDDQSEQPMPRVDRKRTEVVRTPKRSYWAGACNYGASLKPGRDLLFLNQDVHFTGDGWRNTLASIVDGGAAITGNWVKGHPCWPMGYVDGVFMYVRRDAWDAAGGMDAVHYPMWGSSCLLQTQACRKGFKAAPFPHLDKWLVHHRHGNIGQSFQQLLQDEVGTLRNDGNIFRRVPPAVSVVISAHGDYDKYLPEAVESIKAQSRPDWQIVITLDGTARDQLREMAKNYADPWQGIFYVQQAGRERKGPCIVRNAGVAATHTRNAILMLDGDDRANPKAIEVMLPVLEAHPHSFVYGDLRWVGDRAGVRRFPEYSFEELLRSNFIPIVFDYRRHGRSRNHDSQERRDELRGLLRSRYPDAFERRFKPMCCGGNGKATSSVPPARSRARNIRPPAGVGKDGMVEVRYLGSLGAAFSVRGPATGTRYRVRKGWVGWMDVRDAVRIIGDGVTAGISREYEYTGRTSGKAKPPAPKAVPVAVTRAPDPVVVETVTEAVVSKDPDPEPSKPFACPFCDKPYKTAQGLEKHVQLAHPGEYSEWKKKQSRS